MFFEFKIYATFKDETVLNVCDVIEWSKSDLHPTPESFHLDIAREFRAFSTGKVPSFTYLQANTFTRTIRIPEHNLLNLNVESRFTTEDPRLMK